MGRGRLRRITRNIITLKHTISRQRISSTIHHHSSQISCFQMHNHSHSMQWWSASVERQQNYTASCTRSLFVENAYVSRSTKFAWYVVGTYSEWVIDGEYDWPTKCCQCQAVLEESTDPQTTRLDIVHTSCLVSHIKSFPPNTAPAGYICPACSTPIWPPKSVKNSGSRLHSQLKEAIMQVEEADLPYVLLTFQTSGIEKNLFGNHPVSSPPKSSHGPPPAFASDPLRPKGASGNGSAKPLRSGATTRKGTPQGERQTSELSYYADDEDANRRKYTRRGSFRHKFLRSLLPFWSSALPTLPVTAPPKKDANADESHTRHHRPSRMDPRKILLVIAIIIAQRGFGEEEADNRQQ
ncbi:hypothetical protein Ccrd_019802 [Cynara cardunculus var. scolymus]|uniref:ZFPL1-like U-box domain-containing protein n=1 Tax=Cynara cardunculus var. scolymus TaxID=59895 RepID=A0A103Y3L4_CYNCS|nr:hypothetical protein Ccrd_019802 [Cynara cardunculus var. scolymus]